MADHFARHLRKNMTDAERYLWYRLRGRQLAGQRFRRQFPIGSFIVDFVCLEQKLVVELDGGQHAERMESDLARTDWLNSQGFRVLRFWNNLVFEETDGVLEAIGNHLLAAVAAKPTPHPNPPPQGGREPENGSRCEADPST